ncbi:MAG: DUF1844 domain-containing protein [Deltaproteobacteria bacterium]|nr:MAG: DUF1844 domain-containing protein [Deltaproteobacteria bacterium]
MLYLGETPHPESGKAEKNLPLARNTIEVLAMLQDKTQGNLDEEEANLLSTLVDDLRGKLDAVG